ncbi:MAG TPA: NFACT RNA binding domain-containing protein [Ignavibacteriales bacterium]|nr:NFACT RNA binding domain-containing protein [Ignavibacteriales bacterium]
MKDLNIKDEQSGNYKPEEGSKFKHYIIENKYHVYVGKDSANNDLLTVKFAKQNDYWFHARAVPGSHVVLRVENSKEAIPKPVLKKAASLAAFHSKAKTSKLAPVSYTLKKYVTKRKGMEPGKVALLKEDVLLVPPEVPQDCEFVNS